MCTDIMGTGVCTHTQGGSAPLSAYSFPSPISILPQPPHLLAMPDLFFQYLPGDRTETAAINYSVCFFFSPIKYIFKSESLKGRSVLV